MKHIKLSIVLFFVAQLSLIGQSYYYVPDHPAYHLLDRLDIKYGSESFHSSLKNYSREDAISFIYSLDSSHVSFAKQYLIEDNIDLVDLERFQQVDNSTGKKYDDQGIFYTIESAETDLIDEPIEARTGFFRHFYKNDANFLEVHVDNFDLVINPVINLSFGTESDSDNLVYQNTRGFEIRGDIDSKLYFFSSVYENQADFNAFHLQRIEKYQTIPGQGFNKPFNSSISDKLDGFDFLNARAYLGLKVSKSVALEIGHSNQFLGNGYRSLLLSDFGHNYFNFKFIANIWKFNYESVFAELTAAPNKVFSGDQLLPKKYLSLHYLSYKPNKNLELGLFETVVFARENHFELQYLNPVILYRTVEGLIGSADNAIMGLNIKYNIANKYSIYHQTVLDEFKLSEIRDGNGWWANKFGFQFGAKAIDLAGVKNLDVQLEYNLVRPYTFSHRDTLPGTENISVANYSHHSQPLAHQLGSNFKELIFLLKYRVGSKLDFSGRFIRSNYGEDIGDENWGTNILLPLESRELDYGNKIGQGEAVDVNLIGLDASYMFHHNMFLDFRFMLRNQSSGFENFNFETNYFSLGLRINASRKNIDY